MSVLKRVYCAVTSDLLHCTLDFGVYVTVTDQTTFPFCASWAVHIFSYIHTIGIVIKKWKVEG